MRGLVVGLLLTVLLATPGWCPTADSNLFGVTILEPGVPGEAWTPTTRVIPATARVTWMPKAYSMRVRDTFARPSPPAEAEVWVIGRVAAVEGGADPFLMVQDGSVKIVGKTANVLGVKVPLPLGTVIRVKGKLSSAGRLELRERIVQYHNLFKALITGCVASSTST